MKSALRKKPSRFPSFRASESNDGSAIELHTDQSERMPTSDDNNSTSGGVHGEAAYDDKSEEIRCSTNNDDDDEDDDNDTTTQNDNPAENECEYNQIREFASEETKRVRFWRMIVIGSILAAGAAVSTLSYLILKREWSSDYNQSVGTQRIF
jgi:hypothetical protein